jgi:hypothetical protein
VNTPRKALTRSNQRDHRSRHDLRQHRDHLQHRTAASHHRLHERRSMKPTRRNGPVISDANACHFVLFGTSAGAPFERNHDISEAITRSGTGH